MKIFVVRHAVAEDLSHKNKKDETRALTPKGRKEFEEMGKIIFKIFKKVDVIYSSPLLRAKQTAEILEKRYKIRPKVISELRPEMSVEKFLLFLKKQRKENVMIVGHEPFLSRFVSYCVAGRLQQIVEIKKGAICVLKERENKGYAVQMHICPKHVLKI